MTSEQIHRLYWREPFQTFRMLLSDQRIIDVQNLDFITLSPDHRTITIYTAPEEAEVIDLAHVVSVKFREPDLID
ncbi:hypothetical protein BH20VER1_BH20VER1_19570 [soil metagenome]